MFILNYAATYTNTSNSNTISSELFSKAISIYTIIAIAIPIIILLIYLKTCKLNKHIEYLAKQQEYTNDFLIKQIEQNQEIINLLKQERTSEQPANKNQQL